MENNGKKQRPRVGLAVGNYHSDHPIRLVRTVYELLRKEGVDARFYLGTESSSFLSDYALHQNTFDYQYASLYGYSVFDDLDAMILSIGTMTIFQKSIRNEAFLESMQSCPLVLLETEYDKHNGCYLISDNYNAICKLTTHLIEKHHCRNIGFVSGPDGNHDAVMRRDAYLDTMARYGLPIEGRIAHGDFSEHVEAPIRALLDRHPDLEAIVCANDEMAISAYHVCAERGLTVGKDIAIVGFDDIDLARYLDPPLTTARQDYTVTAAHAVQCVMDILSGKKPESRKLYTKTIYRGSCGCKYCVSSAPDDETPENSRAQMIESLWHNHKIEHQPWMGALLQREMMSQVLDERRLFEMVAQTFIHLDTKASFITLLEEPMEMVSYTTSSPERVRLVMAQKGKSVDVYDLDHPVYLNAQQNDLDQFMDTTGCYMTFLLFYESSQYGTMNVRISPEQIPFYYMLSLEIGSALRFMHLSNQRNSAQNSLRAQNNLLDFMANHDELTGLFNRAGIIKEINTRLAAVQEHNAAVFMADMDHLKQINDTFGHPEGDIVIRKAADILRSQMGDGYVLGRIGGDEYMGYLLINSEDDIAEKLASIRSACAIYNQTSGKPYTLTLSMGFDFIPAGEVKDFFQVYHDVDQRLYQAKKNRAKSCIRDVSSVS